MKRGDRLAKRYSVGDRHEPPGLTVDDRINIAADACGDNR